jgi:hypothetical protein
MSTPQELEGKFWKALKSDMTMMLGLEGVDDGHTRPMTAQIDGTRSPIWFHRQRQRNRAKSRQEQSRYRDLHSKGT